MDFPPFTSQQQSIIESPLNSKIFIEGPYGGGKTTCGVARFNYLLHNKIPASEILILVPQRSLGLPYYVYGNSPDFPASGECEILTLGGLARRSIENFWPHIAKQSSFLHPELPPTFLTLETAQYFMAQVVDPLLDAGYFQSVHLHRNRIYSQILDDMNKAAVVGFQLEEIAMRLKNAWNGEPSQLPAYDQAQECAIAFRQMCLEKNLLDYSLQVELFIHHVWSSEIGQTHYLRKYHHLIYDNLEEDVPVTHDLIRDWLPEMQSALLIYDSDGGFRSFLGADPEYGFNLREHCESVFQLGEKFNDISEIKQFKHALNACILHEPFTPSSSFRDYFSFADHQFLPEMVQAVSNQANNLIKDRNVEPEQISILAPYMPDTLRFSLSSELEKQKIPFYSLRPSRSLGDEPVAQCLLSIAQLVHPEWEYPCTQIDLRNALMVVIPELDIVRADLISQTLYSEKKADQILGSFDRLKPEMQSRITYQVGEKIERLRQWIEEYRKEDTLPLYGFFSRIFGELLSQPGFSLQTNLDAAEITSRLINSAKKFRAIRQGEDKINENELTREYIHNIRTGLIASQNIEPIKEKDQKGVLLSPAFTFLMSNRSVKFQFWLDAGSMGWWERLDQPLTHPYVLNRHWEMDQKWTDSHEFNSSQNSMARLVRGLIDRCNEHIFIFTSGMSERGDSQRGPLLLAFQRLIKHIWQVENIPHV
jgi:hypothetical protein